MTSCGGMGPWFCALLFNTSDDCKKQTHLLAHTMPHLASDVLNKSDSDDCWVILIKVGPFEVWEDCVAYLNLWTLKTRGRLRRLERGVEMFRMYAPKLGLTFWYQSETKEIILKNHKTYKNSNRIVAKKYDDEPSVNNKKRTVNLTDMENIFCNQTPPENLTIGMIKSAQLKRLKAMDK